MKKTEQIAQAFRTAARAIDHISHAAVSMSHAARAADLLLMQLAHPMSEIKQEQQETQENELPYP